MTEDWNPFTDEDPEYERHREARDFRNYTDGNFNYLRATLETGIENLKSDGVSKKELKIFIDQAIENAFSEDEKDNRISKETQEALQKLGEAAEQLKNSQNTLLRTLGRTTEVQAEELLQNTYLLRKTLNKSK